MMIQWVCGMMALAIMIAPPSGAPEVARVPGVEELEPGCQWQSTCRQA